MPKRILQPVSGEIPCKSGLSSPQSLGFIFRDLGTRDLGTRDLGTRDLGIRDVGFRDLGFRD